MTNDKQFELGLKLPTDPCWANLAQKNLEDILVDHAYCEQKAASSCISMIVSFPDFEKVTEILSPIVTEEWAHFRMVLDQMKKRGIKLSKKRSDKYVAALNKIEKKGGSRRIQLMEKCIINALIEARSCERFKRLWQHFEPNTELGKFYYQFMVSEAGHYRAFLELAMEYNPKKQVHQRWQEYLELEAKIIARIETKPGIFH